MGSWEKGVGHAQAGSFSQVANGGYAFSSQGGSFGKAPLDAWTGTDRIPSFVSCSAQLHATWM